MKVLKTKKELLEQLEKMKTSTNGKDDAGQPSGTGCGDSDEPQAKGPRQPRMMGNCSKEAEINQETTAAEAVKLDAKRFLGVLHDASGSVTIHLAGMPLPSTDDDVDRQMAGDIVECALQAGRLHSGQIWYTATKKYLGALVANCKHKNVPGISIPNEMTWTDPELSKNMPGLINTEAGTKWTRCWGHGKRETGQENSGS